MCFSKRWHQVVHASQSTVRWNLRFDCACVNGWLMPAQCTTTQLSEALQLLMSSPEKRKVLAEAALSVRQRFSVVVVRQKFLEILSPFLCSSPSCD